LILRLAEGKYSDTFVGSGVDSGLGVLEWWVSVVVLKMEEEGVVRMV